MALYLIGLGLWNEKDISVKGLETAKACKKLYMEEYTSKLGVSKEVLEGLTGKEIKLLSRADVEQSDLLLKEAKNDDVALLVGGDPLVATTHIDLLLQAKKAGIKTKMIHSSSIYTAVCESGLFVYKFGKSCSIPFPEPGVSVKSFYDTVLENQKAGLHTLIFLDLKPEQNRFMSINQALEILIKLGLSKDTLSVGFARLGSEDQFIKAGTAGELFHIDFGGPQHALVIPGKLHFVEEDALKTLS
jgi:diphthine synthase